VHIVSVVPTLLQYLNNYYSDRERPECPALLHIICGAGPLTIKVAETFEERLDVPIIHGYGLSETTCYSCFLPVDLDKKEHQKWMTDYGKPVTGCSVGNPSYPCQPTPVSVGSPRYHKNASAG
jgi:long-chain acyl-CoA synthetase